MGSTISIPRDRQNKIATGIVSFAILSSSHFLAIKSFDSFSISPTSRFLSIQILASQENHQMWWFRMIKGVNFNLSSVKIQ